MYSPKDTFAYNLKKPSMQTVEIVKEKGAAQLRQPLYRLIPSTPLSPCIVAPLQSNTPLIE